MAVDWQEWMHEAISAALAEHSETDQASGVLTAWVLVAETRDEAGEASIGYYRGPETAASWLHRGMLAEAARYIASESEREDDEGS